MIILHDNVVLQLLVPTTTTSRIRFLASTERHSSLIEHYAIHLMSTIHHPNCLPICKYLVRVDECWNGDLLGKA